MALSLSRARSFAPLALLAVLSGCGPGEIQTLPDAGAGTSDGGTQGVEQGTGGAIVSGDGGAQSGVGGTDPDPLPGVGGTEGAPPTYGGNYILIFPEHGEVAPGYIGFAFGTRNDWGVNGPAYTFHDDAGSKIAANVPDPTRVCASGENAAVDLNCGGDCWGKYWGTGWGLNLNQERVPADGQTNEPKAFPLSSNTYFQFNVTGPNVPTTLRVLARAENDDAIYCAPISAGYNVVFTSQLRKNCWEGAENESIDPQKIWAIQFQVASMTYPIAFDYCVEELGIKTDLILK